MFLTVLLENIAQVLQMSKFELGKIIFENSLRAFKIKK